MFLRANDSFQTEINWLKFDNEQIGLAKRLQKALLSGDQKKLSEFLHGGQLSWRAAGVCSHLCENESQSLQHLDPESVESQLP